MALPGPQVSWLPFRKRRPLSRAGKGPSRGGPRHRLRPLPPSALAGRPARPRRAPTASATNARRWVRGRGRACQRRGCSGPWRFSNVRRGKRKTVRWFSSTSLLSPALSPIDVVFLTVLHAVLRSVTPL